MYKSTGLRGPKQALVPMPHALADRNAPAYEFAQMGRYDNDLTMNARVNGEPLGERIIVTGRVLDEDGRPVRNTLVEIWQANAAGRYVHTIDQHDAPLDPNFLGAGRCMTDDQGRYTFKTIKPGAYPWGNHHNAWRPNHIHLSLFGDYFASRLVTQMYFPGDPLLEKHFDRSDPDSIPCTVKRVLSVAKEQHVDTNSAAVMMADEASLIAHPITGHR